MATAAVIMESSGPCECRAAHLQRFTAKHAPHDRLFPHCLRSALLPIQP